MNVKINVPTRAEVSAENQQVYDSMLKALGFVPNLYAAFAHSPTALPVFLKAQNAKSTLTTKEKEAVNLVVSEVNNCEYCIRAHTVLAGKAGFALDEIAEIRTGTALFNSKLDALVRFAKSVAENKGKADRSSVSAFFEAGFTKANLIDAIILIGLRTITNYVYAVTDVPVDWPELSEYQNV